MQTRRMTKEIHQPSWQQQKPDSDGYLSSSPLPAVWWVVGAGFHDRGRVNLAVWSTTQTGDLSTLLSGFLLPHRKTLFFFTPHLHLHIFQQPFCLSFISPLSPQPYLIFHPKGKSHKAVILLAATTLFIFLTCCDISFGACLGDLHFILPCFTPLTMGLWPLECYPNKYDQDKVKHEAVASYTPGTISDIK